MPLDRFEELKAEFESAAQAVESGERLTGAVGVLRGTAVKERPA